MAKKVLVVAVENRPETSGLVTEFKVSSLKMAELTFTKMVAEATGAEKSWLQQANKLKVYTLKNGEYQLARTYEQKEVTRFGMPCLEFEIVA